MEMSNARKFETLISLQTLSMEVIAILIFRILHNYMLWRLVFTIMPTLIDDFQQKRVEFQNILLGILSERVRWSQCVEWTNKKLGMAVGALFIKDNFNQESKVQCTFKFGL